MTRLADRDTPRLVRGSLITLRRRCGRPNCRCATGDPHETPALSYSLNGRTQTVTLTPEDIGPVTASLKRYAAAKEQLETEALAGIESLRARRAATKARR